MAERPQRHDDLFQPTLQRPGAGYSERPWKLSSQFWVAFFGGTLAIAVIAYFNARRLKVPPNTLRSVLLVGGIGTLLTVAIGAYVAMNAQSLAASAASRSILRLAARVAALATYFILQRIQEPFARRFEMFYDRDDYSSLWKPGLAATLILGTLQALVIFLVSLATARIIGAL